MVLERNSRGSTTTWIDVFDRVLGKGIVVDALSVGIPPGGSIELLASDTRIIVLSIDTHLRFVHRYPSSPARGTV